MIMNMIAIGVLFSSLALAQEEKTMTECSVSYDTPGLMRSVSYYHLLRNGYYDDSRKFISGIPTTPQLDDFGKKFEFVDIGVKSEFSYTRIGAKAWLIKECYKIASASDISFFTLKTLNSSTEFIIDKNLRERHNRITCENYVNKNAVCSVQM